MGNSILIIDDEKLICKGIVRLLESEGYNAGYSLTGADAIEKITANGFGLIILDLILPDILGSNVFNQVIKINPDMKIILISGHYQLLEEASKKLQTTGIPITIIQKPFENEEIVEAVNRHLPK